MQVYEFVGLTELFYAGSHGMDIMSPVKGSDAFNGHPNCVKLTDKQVRLYTCINLSKIWLEFIFGRKIKWGEREIRPDQHKHGPLALPEICGRGQNFRVDFWLGPVWKLKKFDGLWAT